MPAPERSTLLDVLRQRFPDSSSTTLRKMLKSDRVRVNGAPERVAKRELGADDCVEVVAKPARPIDPRVRILFEDDDLIVVDKAAGLLTVPSPVVLHETAETFLNAYAGARPGEARVHHVHRLDRDTSGVLVFAKSEYVRDRLQELFAVHDLARVYVAVVHGKLRPPAGTFHCFLVEDRDLRVRRVAEATQGKEAITRYRTTASGRLYSLVELTLETGRRHQIRVQLADAGHPVLGDAMYGKGREDPLGRLALHATHLAFVHPRSAKKMAFTAEMPQSFRELSL
ncbi:MAG TPA: RluA family pseudouridine synthase [Thermoanaerobaculia bacterium]|nr:RluA family pseudouridine synthase [Thermoanaerobaculia bacterium]